MISEITNDRILKTLFKAKLLALVEQLVSLLKRKFPNAFFYKVISIQLLFRVSVRSSFWKYTAKFFYQILGKRLKSEEDNSVCFAGWLVYSAVLKKLNFSRKLSMFETCFSNATLWIYEIISTFPCSDYFRDLYLFSKPNSIVSIGLHQSNYLSNFVKNTRKML